MNSYKKQNFKSIQSGFENLKLTKREIDTISCILNGKTSSKHIATMLSIHPKTAEKHKSGVFQKLGDVHKFVEANNSVEPFRQHYDLLLKEFEFTKALRQIEDSLTPNRPTLYLEVRSKNIGKLVSDIKNCLRMSGINISETPIAEKHIILYRDSYIIGNKRVGVKSFHSLIFAVLEELTENPYVIDIINTFNSKSDKPAEEDIIYTEAKVNKRVLPQKKPRSINMMMLIGGVLILASTVSYFFRGSMGNYGVYAQMEMKTPIESSLIPRESIIRRIDTALTLDSQVSIAVLTGIGGSGKTTLAHIWGKQYKKRNPKATVWEINSESPQTLDKSLQSLVRELGEQEGKGNDITRLNEIEGYYERNAARMSFIRKYLKEGGRWLLIFDNVEKLSDISDILPQDVDIWGKGKIIVTTRNLQIKHSSFIESENVIHVDPLSADESLELFVSLRYGDQGKTLSLKEKESAICFVKHIPPFPLDVSIAATYLAVHGLEKEKYLVNLREQSKAFQDAEKNIVIENHAYSETRYSLISTSLERILSKNEKYGRMLYLMSRIKSQLVPVEIFGAYVSGEEVKDFLIELNRHSLITSEEKVEGLSTISVHKSTQEMMEAYFSSRIGREDTLYTLNTFLSFAHRAIDWGNSSVIRALGPHVRAIVNDAKSLHTTNEFKGVLGCVELYRGRARDAADFLESALKVKKNDGRLLLHLGRSYQLLSLYEEAERAYFKCINSYMEDKDHSGIVDARSLLAHLYYVKGDYLKSEAQIDLASQGMEVDGLRKLPIIRVKYIKNLIQSELGEYQEAAKTLEEGLELIRKGVVDEKLAVSLASLGLVYSEMGNYSKAKGLLDEAIEYHKKYDKHSAFYWMRMSYAASVYRKMGVLEKAQEMLEQSLDFIKANAKDNTLDLGYTMTQLGKVYKDLGYLTESKCLLSEAYDLYKASFGQDSLRNGS